MRLKQKRWVPGMIDQHVIATKWMATARDERLSPMHRDEAVVRMGFAWAGAILAASELNFTGRWVYVEEGEG